MLDSSFPLDFYFTHGITSGGASVKEPTSSAGGKRLVFDPWVRQIPLEESKATHSSTLVWRIPWIEERGGLQSMRSQRVGHD